MKGKIVVGVLLCALGAGWFVYGGLGAPSSEKAPEQVSLGNAADGLRGPVKSEKEGTSAMPVQHRPPSPPPAAPEQPRRWRVWTDEDVAKFDALFPQLLRSEDFEGAAGLLEAHLNAKWIPSARSLAEANQTQDPQGWVREAREALARHPELKRSSAFLETLFSMSLSEGLPFAAAENALNELKAHHGQGLGARETCFDAMLAVHRPGLQRESVRVAVRKCLSQESAQEASLRNLQTSVAMDFAQTVWRGEGKALARREYAELSTAFPYLTKTEVMFGETTP